MTCCSYCGHTLEVGKLHMCQQMCEALGTVACSGTGEPNAISITEHDIAGALEVYHANSMFGDRTALIRALKTWRPDMHLSDEQIDEALRRFREAKGYESGMRAAMESVR